MNNIAKKIKTIDLTSLLSFLLFIGGIVFFILFCVFKYTEFGGRSIDVSSNKTLETLTWVVLGLGCVFIFFAIVSAIVVGIFCVSTKWPEENLRSKCKLLGILNFIPLLMSVPGMLISKKLVHFMKSDKFSDFNKTQENNSNNKINQQEISSKSNLSTQATQLNNDINQNNQNQNSTTTQTIISYTSSSSYPMNEPFWYINKWMYYDGTTYYEANENNQWVVSNTIPR